MTTGACYGNPEAGLSEVIGFVLALALIVAIMSTWIIYVVPVDGRNNEIAQMNSIRDQFTEYKIGLDEIRSAQTINNLSPVMTSTSIILGTAGGDVEGSGLFLSLLRPVASPATLSVRDTGDSFDIDSSSYHGSPADMGEFPMNITSLDYSSANNYFIQQRYSYALGGIFLSQPDGVTNRVPPLISLQRSANNSVIVTVVPVKISGGGTIGGIGPVRIDTRFRTLAPYNISMGSYQPNT